MGWRSDDYEPRGTWRDAAGVGAIIAVLLALAVAKGLSKGDAMDAVHRAGRPTPADAIYRR